MDFDNDGHLDLISGSYDPGDLYLFRGLGDGEYAKIETILDEDDLPLVHHPVELAKFQQFSADSDANSEEAIQVRVASFGSWPAPVDWDADGDLDMLIGSFGGRLFLRENIGTRQQPKFSRQSTPVNANGEALSEDCHACPAVADWDGDGVWDLVVGSGDGSVGWYRNIGSASNPEFGSRNLLVAPASARARNETAGDSKLPGKFFMQTIAPGEDPVQGARAQICVVDYNRDGLLDLIVGDYSDIDWSRELSETEQTEFENLKQQLTDIGEKLAEVQQKLYPTPGDGEEAPEVDEAEREKLEAEYQEVIGQYQKLDEKRKSFFAESRSASFIWYYQREAASGNEQTSFDEAEEISIRVTDRSKTPERNSAGPVMVATRLEPTKTESVYRAWVTFEIQPGWHLYANSAGSANQAVRVKLKSSDHTQLVDDWRKPVGKFSADKPGASIYRDSVTFSCDVKIDSPAVERKIQIEISYQVCNESLCLPPESLVKTVAVTD